MMTEALWKLNSLAMIKTKTAPIATMMSIIFIFFHQNLLLSFPACCSNWEAPCCKASARSSSSESFESRSRTFSTLVRMISTTSSTCACVCWIRFDAA